MCKIMQEILDEERLEDSKRVATNLAKQGIPIDSIAMAVEQSIPTVESWIKESGASAGR